jgi:hypothetical protein
MSIEVNFASGYAPAEAERGKFVVIDSSTLTGLPSSSRGRYALLTYDINATSATNTVNLLPNTTLENVLTLTNASSSTLIFSPPVVDFEVFSGNESIYLSFNATTYNDLTAKGLPIQSNSYYSMKREISRVSIGTLSSCEVRTFGHYRN